MTDITIINSKVPLYRANVLKKVDEFEWIIGHLKETKSKNGKKIKYSIEVIDDELLFNARFIDIKTLAIYLPNMNMEDVDGEILFASLNKNGVGGDKVKPHFNDKEYGTLCFGEFSQRDSSRQLDSPDVTGLYLSDEEGHTMSFNYCGRNKKKYVEISQ